MKQLLGLSFGLVLILGCEAISPNNTLRNELTNTAWRWDRSELLESGGTILRSESADTCLTQATFAFLPDKKFIRRSACDDLFQDTDCGAWDILDERLSMLSVQGLVVPEVCALSNSRGSIISKDRLTYQLAGQQLIIQDTLDVNDVLSFLHRMELTADELGSLRIGELVLKSYYAAAPMPDIVLDSLCCIEGNLR